MGTQKSMRASHVLLSILLAINAHAVAVEPTEEPRIESKDEVEAPGTPFGIEGAPHDAIDPMLHQEDELPLIKIISDPLEGPNRVSYSVSDGILYRIVRPVGKGFRFLTPAPVRRCVDKFGDNLAFPVRLVNNLLQGKGKGAAEETGRFVVNSTVGIAGLFDPATKMGLDAHREDFGQTFGHWGAPPGFYVFIPMIGPSSVRDGVGLVGDTLLNPATYVSYLSAFLHFNRFTSQIDNYEILRQSQSDPYVIVREVWGIDREKNVRDYTIPPEAYDHGPTPTIEAVHFRVEDGRFSSPGSERSVKIEATGEKLPYSYWMQKSPAPAVFVVPGMAGHRNSEMVRALTEVLYNAGFSVVAISSSFNWEFISRAATTSMPGYTPVDSVDVYNAMSAVSRDLDERYPGRITSKALLGLSLGGLQTLFIADAEADRGEDSLKFDRYVAVNPPCDPAYSLSQLDSYYNAPKQWDEEIRARKVEETLMKAAVVFSQPEPAADKGAGNLPFDKIESQFMIGVSYRYGLRNAIYEIHRSLKLNQLKTPFNWFRRDPLYDEITAYSYGEYLREFVLPHYQAQSDEPVSAEDFYVAAGLRSLKGTLVENESVFVFTNWNDFVLSKEDVAWMQEAMKDRITVFPEGGHLGNLHIPEVQTALLECLKK